MKIIKFILIILGSALFIPVSCTIGVVAGTQVVARMDSRDVNKGDTVHSRFNVVAVPPQSENKNDFLVLSLKQVERMKKDNKQFSFLMPRSDSGMETDTSLYSYRILEDRGKEQIIEVVEEYKDGDNTIWSQYRVTAQEVFPISSRMFYFGYMFEALPYSLLISICLYVCGVISRRRLANSITIGSS